MTGSASNSFKYSLIQQEQRPAAQQLLSRESSADWYVFGFAATPLGRFYSITAAEVFAKLYEELCEALGGVPAPTSPGPSDFAMARSACLVQWSQKRHTGGFITEDVDALFKNPPQPIIASRQRTSSPS